MLSALVWATLYVNASWSYNEVAGEYLKICLDLSCNSKVKLIKCNRLDAFIHSGICIAQDHPTHW